MHEAVTGLQPALGMKLRHARRGAGAARAAVDGLVAIEHRVACIRARNRRRARPKDVRKAPDARIQRMNKRIKLIEASAQHWAPRDKIARLVVGHVAVVRLRLDDGVKIPAIGHVHR